MEEINYDVMRYDLDSDGYVLNVYFGCASGTCKAYEGEVPEGYSSLQEWFENANTRAYKIVDNNLVFDAQRDAELQSKCEKEAQENKPICKKDLYEIQETIKDMADMSDSSYEKATVSGKIVKISDAKTVYPNIAIKDIECYEYDKVNLFITGKNMLPNTATSEVLSNVRFTQNTDRSISLDGTAAEDIEYNIAGTSTSTDLILGLKKNVNYYLDSDGFTINMYHFDGTDRTAVYSGNGRKICFTDETKRVTQITLFIPKGTVLNDVTVYPRLSLEEYSGTEEKTAEDTFITAKNTIEADTIKVNRILGDSKQETRSGKNICPTDFSAWESGQYNQNGNKVTYAVRICLSELLPVKPNTSYYIHANHSELAFTIREYDSTGTFIKSIGGVTNGQSRTTSASAGYWGLTLYHFNGETGKTYDDYVAINESGEFKPFICLKSETDKTFEEYGQMPSPNYPSKVESVGDNINYLPNNAITETRTGITCTRNDDGSLTFNGTSTNQVDFYLVGSAVAYKDIGLEPDVYTLSGTPIQPNPSNGAYIYIVKKASDGTIKYAPQTGLIALPIEFTEGDTVRCFIRVMKGAVLDNLVFYPRLNKGEYIQPYAMHNQGSTEVKVDNKNVFKLEQISHTRNGVEITIDKEADEITLNGTASATTYISLGRFDVVKGKRYVQRMSNKQTGVGLNLNTQSGFLDTGRFNLAAANTNKGSLSTPALIDGKDIVLWLYFTSGTVFNNFKFKNEIEVVEYTGRAEDTEIVKNQNQTVRVYLDREYCKIDNDQDYLYKDLSANKWYKHKKIDEYILNTTGNWAKSTNTSVDRYTRYHTIPKGTKGMCNYFVVKTGLGIDVGTFFFNEKQIVVNFAPYGTTTLEDFKTFISTHTVKVKYVLDTPIEEEITNPVLIEQYDKLLELQAYNDLTHISSDGFAILDVNYNEKINKYYPYQGKKLEVDISSYIDEDAIYPADDLYPSDTLYPTGTTIDYVSIENRDIEVSKNGKALYHEETNISLFNNDNILYTLQDTLIELNYCTNKQKLEVDSLEFLQGKSTTSNEFTIHEDGSIEAHNGIFSGDIYLENGGKVIGGDGLLTNLQFNDKEDFFGFEIDDTNSIINKNKIEISAYIPNNFKIIEAKVVLEHAPVRWLNSENDFLTWGYCRNVKLYKCTDLDYVREAPVYSEYLESDDSYYDEISGAFGTNGFTAEQPTEASHRVQVIESIDISNELENGLNQIAIFTSDDSPDYVGDWQELNTIKRIGQAKAYLNIIGYMSIDRKESSDEL